MNNKKINIYIASFTFFVIINFCFLAILPRFWEEFTMFSYFCGMTTVTIYVLFVDYMKISARIVSMLVAVISLYLCTNLSSIFGCLTIWLTYLFFIYFKNK